MGAIEALSTRRATRNIRMAGELLRFAAFTFGAGLLAAIFAAALVIVLAQPAHASTPAPRLLVPAAEKPIVLQKLAISAEVSGPAARTTVEMTFYNPNPRQLEGELQFPLLDGQQVTGFALDIEGKLRDAVVVPKSRGQEVFEDITRQRVDPGLLQSTLGNNFKLRVYPIFPNRTRTVSITYTESLTKHGARAAYRLPLEYGAQVEVFSADVVVRDTTTPRVTGAVFRDIPFTADKPSRPRLVQRADFTPKGMLEITIDSARATRVLSQELDGQHYFYAQIPAGARKTKRKLPGTLGIIWDSSASGAGRNHVRELALLRRYFDAVKNADVHLVRVRDIAEATEIFHVENGDWSSLRRALEESTYDGATNLGAFAAEPAVREYLLFSDGLGNYGERPFAPPGVPVYAISSSAQANPAWLKHVAHGSGGRYVDLLAQTPESATESLLFDVERIRSLSSDGAAQLAAPSPHPENDMLSITGLLIEPAAAIRVELEKGGRRTRTVTFRARQRGNESTFAGSFWARARIAALEADYEANRAEILRLGQNFSLVTRETSLIVLETVRDYVRFAIEPPKELMAEYERVRAGTRAVQRPDPQQKIDRVVAMLNDREAWWKREFSKGPIEPVVVMRHAPPPPPQKVDAPKAAYWTDSQGAPVRSTVANVCVRSGQWTPALAIAECDPDFTHKPVAPPMTAFAPQPAPAPPPKPQAKPKPAKPAMAFQSTVHAPGGAVVRAWSADAPYRARLRDAAPEDAYRVYLDERPGFSTVPAFYIDVADILAAKGLRPLALRVLSNLAEIDLEDRHTLRSLAARLVQEGEPKLAVALYKRIVQLSPEEPQSFRDLGLALAAAGEHQRAADTLYEVVTRSWNPRFPEIELVALNDLNSIVSNSKIPLDVSRMDSRLLRNMPVDLRVVLTWDADNTNLDLMVTDPNGQTVSHGAASFQGGRLSRNFMTGYGPEEYAVRAAKSGTYRIAARFSQQTRQTTGAGPVYAHVHVYSKFGTPEQTVRTHNVMLNRVGLSTTVTEVAVP